jgi:YkoY family integral membrane protein
MTPQSFAFSDLGAVLALILLEGLLSADNALVLAIMVKHLPKEQQQRALLYGLGGAFVFRLIAIVFASIVLGQWWLQAVGALYLLYLPIKHFVSLSKHEDGGKSIKKAGFWQTVIAVELTDIAFALDSVLAGIGFIMKPGAGVQQDKIWVVYLGAVIGIILLRFAASFFVRLLERFPALDHVAYILVGWVGVKLAAHAIEKLQKLYPSAIPFAFPYMTEGIFWGGLILIAVAGSIYAITHARSDSELELDDEADILETVQDLEVDEGESSGSRNP